MQRGFPFNMPNSSQGGGGPRGPQIGLLGALYHLFWALVPSKYIVPVATLGPVGSRTKAPGTWGSAVGILCYVLVLYGAAWWALILITGALALLAIPFCQQGALRLNNEDPGCIVLDEFVAIPLVFVGIVPSAAGNLAPWAVVLLGFAWFRLFDIIKPFGIRRLEKLGSNVGTRIVIDDLAAAVYACLALHVSIYLSTLV